MKIFGKNPVFERIKQNPKSIRKIYVEEGLTDTAYLVKKATQWNLKLIVVPKTKMQKLARNVNAQGVMVEVDAFDYWPYDDLLEHASKKKQHLLFLDGLNDPQNLGAIVRSLACLGHFAIVIPKKGSVDVTETVLRIACGGENYVPIAKVTNMSQALSKAKDLGFWIAGTVVKSGQDLYEQEFPFPLGIVIGSEQKGIRSGLIDKLDVKLTIPMHNQRMSFNAAHATTLICSEVLRQSRLKKSS